MVDLVSNPKKSPGQAICEALAAEKARAEGLTKINVSSREAGGIIMMGIGFFYGNYNSLGITVNDAAALAARR